LPDFAVFMALLFQLGGSKWGLKVGQHEDLCLVI